ncbi:MAG: selenium-binding family protein [Pseudonocardia sp.]|nr:selenium-binding family protein [Pseudonocardia sp.]
MLRAWETDRGAQHFHYDTWWHLNQNTLISSEWGSPSMVENGVVPELLLGQKYGHCLHFWGMVEVSRDGKRVYFTNSLYGAWDDGDDLRGLRPHQVRLQGGDASSDSYCHWS